MRFRRASIQWKAMAFFYDLIMVALAWVLACWLRSSLSYLDIASLTKEFRVLPLVLIVQAVCYFVFGLHRGVWRFTSIGDLAKIIKAVLAGVLLSLLLIFFLTRFEGIPRTVFFMYTILLVSLMSGSRLLVRMLYEKSNLSPGRKRILVIGAGASGDGFVREIQRGADYVAVGFLDDNKAKQGSEIRGLRVLGRSRELLHYAEKLSVDLVVIAMPSANAVVMRRIVALCESAEIEFLTLPSISDITSGRVNISELREVAIEDLLGREEVSLDWDKIQTGVNNKVIMVTGGGGSIGSELCRQIASLSPGKLLILDSCEYNLYKVEMELQEKFPYLEFKTLLADVTDKVAVHCAMKAYKPQIVFHAAAYKHVPILEYQLRVALLNNLIGTKIMAEASNDHGVEKFVLISSDKAVHPENVMGATKRAAEILCQNYDAHSKTQFITTRFGNVIGSSGSVIPLFKKQLLHGGPLTVTHKDITRFFMTIPEAAQLILQTTVMGAGGEIFVLDMGEPIKITYLAEQLIRLSGKTLGRDIEIKFTGLRPGEKLYEELFYGDEQLVDTAHVKVFRAQSSKCDWLAYSELLDETVVSLDEGRASSELTSLLHRLVPKYAVRVAGASHGKVE